MRASPKPEYRVGGYRHLCLSESTGCLRVAFGVNASIFILAYALDDPTGFATNIDQFNPCAVPYVKRRTITSIRN